MEGPKLQLGQGFNCFKYASRSRKILFGHLLLRSSKVGMKQYATNTLVDTFLAILASNIQQTIFLYLVVLRSEEANHDARSLVLSRMAVGRWINAVFRGPQHQLGGTL